MRKRRIFSSKFKFKVAMEALSGRYTIAELCQRHSLHATQIHKWKKHLESEGQDVFSSSKQGSPTDQSAQIEALQAKVGELLMERDFLKKVLAE